MREGPVGEAIRTHIYQLSLPSYGCGSCCPQTIIIITSTITDHRLHNKYNKNDNVWNIARIPKMWQKHKVGKFYWKNGIMDRLAWHRVVTNLQFVKTISVKSNKVKPNKMRYAYTVHNCTWFIFIQLIAQ